MPSYSTVIAMILCILIFWITHSPVTALLNPYQTETEKTASVAIEEGANKLFSAFKEVRKADKAGAKVGSLISSLNEAEHHLGAAIIAKETGKYSNAVNEANLAIQIAERVEKEAKQLRRHVEQTRLFQWVLIPLLLIWGVAAGILILKWLRSRLKRHAEEKFLRLRIEY